MSQELFPGREVAFAHRALYASGRWGLPVNCAWSQARLPLNVVAAPESSKIISTFTIYMVQYCTVKRRSNYKN
jgi:hypothetical protein